MEKENKVTTEQVNPGMMEPEKKEPEKKEESTSFLKELISWAEVIVAAILISLFLTRVVLVNAMVPTASMENLIEVGDRLFGNRLAYKFHDPERFDVVIFKNPLDEEENYIKRLIGLPGDHVEIFDGEIYINGSDTPLDENYLPEEWDVDNDGYIFDVPKDCYLMLGDNRNVSLDARFWAQEAYDNGLADTMEEAQKYTYVHKDQLLGKALFTYYPHFTLLSDYEE